MNVYVMPSGDEWGVKREGEENFISVHDRKKDAIETAKEVAMGQEAGIVIFRKDGSVDNLDSYAIDPFPSPDRAPDYNDELDEDEF